MKKISKKIVSKLNKLLKTIMLISMIFSSLQTPIYVFADEVSGTESDSTTTPQYEKGDMKIGETGEITKEGTISVTSKSTDENIKVTKTITADPEVEGKYKVDFEITGNSSEEEAPVYVVLVFDTSGSMCDSIWGYCANQRKWNNAVSAAQTFAKTIIDTLVNSKVALVTFSSNASQKRAFTHDELGVGLFGSPGGGTNLHDGLLKAQSYLTNNIPTEDKEKAHKYVVVMSDGEPTLYNGGGDGETTTSTVLDNTFSAANAIKNAGAQIYSIGYSLPSNDVYRDDYTLNGVTYDGLTAKEILQLVASPDTEEDKENNTQHYQDASSEDTIVEVFEKVAKSIIVAGKNATLTDKIGTDFKFISTNTTTTDGIATIGGTSTPSTNGFGGNYVSNEIKEITKDKITISFNIEINKDATTGWHQTNRGFVLEYKDAEGNTQTIKCEDDPYVYWVQNQYDYDVNYYKDSIAEGNLLASETRQAPAGTIIDESNVEKDKYLSQAGPSYEFSNLTPTSITITNDGVKQVINVLYVKVYGNLTVKHVDTAGTNLINPVTTTKEIGTSYTTSVEDIYGYTVTTIPSNANGTYTKEAITVTYVYTKNEGKLENAENYNVVKTQINPIIGANSKFNYVLTYTGKVKDYLGSATLTLEDTLPYEVLFIDYPTGCSYEENTRKLTCTKTVELNENNQTIDATFNITVTYKNLTSTTDLEITNTVNSTLTFGNTNVPDTDKVTDIVKSNSVTAVYVDEAGKELAESVTTTGLIDTDYETTEKEIYGYTLKEIIGEEKGKYTEAPITVTYVYTKNPGTTETNEVTKVGPENITSVDGVFNYTLTYNGKITDYVGDVKLTLKDTLPYEIDEERSTYDDRCSYENKVLTCTETYKVSEGNTEIKDSFELSLVFKNVDSDKVTNKVESTLDYGKETPDKDEDETETEVFKGTVIATYVDESGKELAESVPTTGLADTDYETSKKTIYGYTFKEVNGEETGKYVANETIEVEYIYTKNEGSVDTNEVSKKQTSTIIGTNSTFNYVLTYKGKVNNYLGTATLTLEDTLPYEVLFIDYPKGCSYEENTRKLTCTKTDIQLDENNQSIDATFNITVTYKNLISNIDLEITNTVNSTLTFGNTNIPDTDKVTDIVKSSSVTATYVDESNNTLAESVTTTGLIDTDYETTEKEIYGYTLKEITGEEKGKYTEAPITVTYIYTKNEGKTETNEVTKVGPENITSVNGVFNYTLTYTGKITDYVGKAKLTLKDTLPYEIDEELSKYEGCTYENKVLTCTKEYEIDKDNQDVTAEFNLSLVFKNVDSNKVTNKVESTLDYGKDTPDKDTDETETEVFKGTVIATYVDEAGKELAESVPTTGLADTDYETSKKTIYGYTFKEVNGKETGKYVANETIEVEYIYTKNEGKTETNEVTKVGPENITSVDGVFNYTLTYNGKITDYVGDVKLTLKDTLPYEIDEERSTYDDRCSYENKVLTCTETYKVSEGNTEIKDNFELSLVFKNVDSNKVTNKVESTLDYGKDTPDKDKDETETEVFKGTVIATYVDESGNTLAETVTTTGLADTDYETTEKEIYGYTLDRVEGKEKGKYIANETIEVEYIYTKNEGKTETNEVTKVGPENITSVDGTFNYTLTYNGKITDYVGDVKLTLKDTLPYEIDEERSTYDDRCSYENKVLTCTETYKVSEGNTEIKDSFELSLVFKNVDSNKVTNKVESTLDYGKETPDKDTDETETEVFKGEVIATYKNKQGEVLAESIKTEGLAGTNYETKALEFLGYTLTATPENQNGLYVANQTIYVDYIYDKNIGTSEENLEKQGPNKILDINAPFEYIITYNLEIHDYVGDVKITLTDKLPYEIDEEKSQLGDVCKYVDGTLVCEYLQTITNKDNSKISIKENLVLYYKNITSNKVTNRVEASVVYGDQEKTDEDEFTTEIPYGSLKVNYVTEDGKTLAPTTITTDLLGTSYTTEQKVFDNYYLKEVIGKTEGTYTEEDIEVTYVYSLIPLPPQTGIDYNTPNYLGLFIFAAVMLLIKRRYL